jgi:hypothetical protein
MGPHAGAGLEAAPVQLEMVQKGGSIERAQGGGRRHCGLVLHLQYFHFGGLLKFGLIGVLGNNGGGMGKVGWGWGWGMMWEWGLVGFGVGFIFCFMLGRKFMI